MDYVDMKRRDLQALCKKHNLLASGTNSDLVSRLTSALKKEEVEAKPVTRHVKKKGVSVGEESEKSVDLGKGLDGKKSKPTRNEAEKKSSVNQDVPVPTRATRSRGDVGEVVDIHSFPVEKKKKSVRGGVEDSSDGGVKEMAVRSTRSRGVVEEAAVLPNVEKTRSKKEGNAKNHSEVKEVTSVRTTRSRVGEEVSDINHSSPVVKKTTKGKEVSTKNEDGMQKVISVRTTRSRVGEEVSDINHSSPVVKKTTKGKEVNTKNEDGMKKEISVRTTRSRVAEEVTEINHSSPVVKKTAKGKGVSTENDDGVKNEISVRTTRSRVASGVVDGHASPPEEKKGKKRGRESSEKDEEVKQELSLRSTRSRSGADVAVSHSSPPADKKNAKRRKVNMKNDDGEKVIPVRTTRSRVGAETSVTHSPSPAEKNKRKEGKVNTEDNGGNKEISVRTRSRIAAVVPLNRSSPAVKNKVERGVGTKNIDGVEEVQVRTTRSRQGTETDFLPSASKKRTRGEMKVENTRTQKDVLATRSLRGKEIKGQDVNTEQNTPPRKRRKVIEDEREEEVKEVAALKKSTRQTPSKLRNDKNGRKGKGTLKLGKKAPQSKRFVEPPKKPTRAGGSNSKRKDLAINVNSVAPCDEKLQTDENSKNKNSKKTPAQKQGRKSIKSDGKSSSPPEELPQRSTRSAPRCQSVNVDADSSVHKVQGSDDVPSFVRENVDETVGIVKAVEESISMKEDGVPIGVPIVQGGLINSIDEATQMELEAKNVDDARNEVINEEVVDDAPKEDFAQTLTYVGGINEEASTYQNNNQLNAAAKETVDIAGEINNNVTVSEDFPLEGASGTILMGISSGSKNVIESKNDLVTDHDVSLQDEAREEVGTNQKTVDIVGAEVQTEMDGATYVDQTSTGRQVTEPANLNIDVAGEINSPVNELKPQNEEASLSSRDSPSQSNSGALNVAEDINELDTSFEKIIDVAGSEDNLERDDTAIDETSTSQHITESPNQDINVAREINHPVMELNTENEEDLPTSEEVRMQSTGGTVDVAEENNELDIASNKAFEEAGADDHTKTDGNVITEAFTEPDTATVENIVAPGEISPPVLELEAQIDEDSTIPEESPIPSTSGTSPDIIRGKMGADESEKHSVKDHMLSLSNETKHMDKEAHVDGNVDTSTGEAIIEPDTDGSMLVAETSTGEAIIEPDTATAETSTGEAIIELDTATAENIDAPGEINAPVLELETEIDETSPTPEASPIRSISGTSPDSSGKMGVDESEKDSVHDHTLPLSSETRHTDQETHVDGNVDTSRDDRAKLEDFVCGLPKSEEVTVPTTVGNNTECIISTEKNVEDNEEVSVTVSHKNEFSENPVDVTGEISDEDTSGSEQQNEMAKEDPVTMPTTFGTSAECIINVEMDVGDNEEVFVLSHMSEITETPVDARGEKSVVDTSASEQQNELSQEDPITMPTTIGTSRECYISGENDISFIVSHANEISEIHVDITGERSVEDTSASEQQNELVQENPFTVPTNVDSSRECIISDENNVDDNEDVMVIVSHANESQTPLDVRSVEDTSASKQQDELTQADLSDENNVDDNEDVMVIVSHANESQTPLDVRSVEDTSASKQQDELTQADPVMDVGHLSTAESPKSRGPFNFDDASALDHDRETSSMMLHESPELPQGKPCCSDGLNTAALDKVGEGSVVKSCEISQETSVVESREEKHHSNLEKLDMEFVEEHVKEDATMIVQELPELPQSNADIGTEDTGKDTSMFQETTDASLDESPADAELVEDYGEASVAKSDEALVVKSETMNYSFEFLIDQVSGGHPRESDTSDIKSFESRVFQEFSVEDVGKDLILSSQEVLEENIELSKEVNCGSDSDDPIVTPWDANNEDLEASVEEFDLIPDDEECGSIRSRKEEMNTNTSGVLDSSAMMDRDFDYGVWDEENAVAPPVPQRELGFRDLENEYRASAINAGDDKKPSEGASEMFVDFNEVADLHLNTRPGAISPFYTQDNVNEQNFGSVDHFMPRESWHMQDDFVDLKSYTNSETHSHVEYSQSHVEYSHVHQELVDPKISGANFVQGQGTESWKPVHAEHHGQTSRGSDYVKARESSPGSSHRR